MCINIWFTPCEPKISEHDVLDDEYTISKPSLLTKESTCGIKTYSEDMLTWNVFYISIKFVMKVFVFCFIFVLFFFIIFHQRKTKINKRIKTSEHVYRQTLYLFCKILFHLLSLSKVRVVLLLYGSCRYE